jgi:cell division protein FtsW
MKWLTNKGTPDLVFVSLLGLLTVFGLVMLASASSDLGYRQFADSYYYLNHQLINGLAVGFVAFLIGYFVYYRAWENLALPLLIVSLLLLIAVFTPLGIDEKGSERWLNLGAFSFQPGEVLKFTFFVYLAAWAAKSQARSKSFWGGFVPLLIVLGMVMGLLFAQPATTIAVLICGAAIFTYFTAGAPFKYLGVVGLLAAAAVVGLVLVTPYRMDRIKTFINPEQVDELGSGYQITNAKTAIGTGGLWGVGYGQSTGKFRLPEQIGDSIFAVIGEEFGFVGSITFLLVYASLIWRGLRIARRAPDHFGRLLATGFMSILALQAFVNIGAISGLIPLTGMPLPFVSYGGTALAIFLAMGGVVANISRYRR